MENKQTAVEWLIQGIVGHTTLPIETINELILKSISMGKEQIGRAYQEGLIDGMNHSPKDYYNETYNATQLPY